MKRSINLGEKVLKENESSIKALGNSISNLEDDVITLILKKGRNKFRIWFQLKRRRNGRM
jgi:hypothetical protein